MANCKKCGNKLKKRADRWYYCRRHGRAKKVGAPEYQCQKHGSTGISTSDTPTSLSLQVKKVS